MKVLSFGEVLWDTYTDSKHIGGAPLNFAAHFKKCGGESWIVTAVGNDALGDETVLEIEKMGVKTEFINRSDKRTGECLVTLDEKQIPSYNLLDNVAYDDIKKPDLGDTAFDALYFGTLSLRNENNREVLKQIISENNFSDIFVDVNIRAPYYSSESVDFALRNATIVKISDEELPTVMSFMGKEDSLAEESAEILSEKFGKLKMVIITKGDKGAFLYDCVNKKTYTHDAAKVEVVSTVGAGDSFSAAFLSEYHKTADIKKALALATKISGYVVSQKGAIPSYNMTELELNMV